MIVALAAKLISEAFFPAFLDLLRYPQHGIIMASDVSDVLGDRTRENKG